jgi:L-ascorbate metabolism protein UlaG (beta-lactamase superfamily)
VTAVCLCVAATPAVAQGPVQNQTRGVRYATIQAAIDDASDGELIVAAPGTYAEGIDFHGKALAVRSQDPNDPLVVSQTVIDGAGADAAAIFAVDEDANSVLSGFTLTGASFGLFCAWTAPRVINCRILGNVEAGVHVSGDAQPTIVNCVIAENTGPGVDVWDQSAVAVDHCTIVGNDGSGIRGTAIVLTNSILWNNGRGGGVPEIDVDAATVSYCDVEGGYPGTGNMDEDPLFVLAGHWTDPGTPTASWVRGDYHLLPESLCVDAGDPAFAPDVTTADIDGDDRVFGGRTDIGCDELPQPVSVTWLGHASVRLARKDTVVYIDPYRLTAHPKDADLVLVTHSHSDHYSPSDIARVADDRTEFVAPPDVVNVHGRGMSIAPGQSLNVAGVHVAAVAAYNLTKTNHPKANNWVGFIVEFGGSRIYLAGDTDLTPEMKALTDIDLAFLPAGGTYTMDAAEAAEATKYILPTLAVPYHWGTVTGSPSDAERFARLAACYTQIMTAGQTLASDSWFRDASFLAHWKLDEKQGIVASDSVGGHDGTFVGDPNWQPIAGRVDGASFLDGVEDFIATSFVLNPAETAFSVFAWVKGGGPGQTILSQIGGTAWLAAGAPDGALMTQLKSAGRGGKDLVSSAVITDGD